MSECLLEIYVEEIPAMMQKGAEDGYYRIFKEQFTKAQIDFRELKCYVGPRRIAIHALGLVANNNQASQEVRGPKIDSPAQALQGFLKKYQVDESKLTVKEVKGKEYYFYTPSQVDMGLKERVQIVIEKSVFDYTWPKSMFWGRCAQKFVRPVRNILCLLDNDVLEVKLFDLVSNRFTYGHRFMNYKKIEIDTIDKYFDKLSEAKVVLDREERKGKINKEIQNIIQKSFESDGRQLVLSEDNKLLEEISGLVEYPIVYLGKISESYTYLPSEILVSAMRKHQKYFTLQYQSGKFAPYFLFVTNIEGHKEDIISGNEKVLSSRLADAKFFYEQDSKTKLSNMNEKLKKVVFHENIGTTLDKSNRLVKLTQKIAGDNKVLQQAAALSKADLVSEVVQEFPELQGIIGGYLAEKEFNNEVAICIKEHYLPLHIEGQLPKGNSAILSLADKVDNLVSLYIAGERATGSKDPYALRRQAISILKIVLANKMHINFEDILKYAIEIASKDCKNKVDQEKVYIELLSFIEERYKNLLTKDYKLGLVESICNLTKDQDIYQNYMKLQALDEFMREKEGVDLVRIYSRINNILHANKFIYTGGSSKEEISNDIELSLYDELQGLLKAVDLAILDNKYQDGLRALSSIQKTVDLFFDKIQVVTEDSKATTNRLQILTEINRQFDKIANFQCLSK